MPGIFCIWKYGILPKDARQRTADTEELFLVFRNMVFCQSVPGSQRFTHLQGYSGFVAEDCMV